jgi:hypothetical protein
MGLRDENTLLFLLITLYIFIKRGLIHMEREGKEMRNVKLVGEVCLYGAGNCGAGWLARSDAGKGMLGTGVPNPNHNYADAMLLACAAIVIARGMNAAGMVRIFDAGGTRFADVCLMDVSSYWILNWKRSAA